MSFEQESYKSKCYFGCRSAAHMGVKQNCPICKLQMKAPDRFAKQKRLPLMEVLKPETVKTITYFKLIQNLLPPQQELEGCYVGNYPETVFFDDDGNRAFIAHSDREGKLTSIW